MVAALTLWVHSAQFQNMVRHRLAAQLQNATGGRVEIASFHWRPLRLVADARGIIIHGDEAPSEAPYARIERLQVSLSILGIWSPRILLRNLEIARPQIHLIFYPDGATNQPHPAKPLNAKHTALETLFNLQADHLAVENGMIDLDNRAAWLDAQNRYQPLDFRGDDIAVVMHYVPAAAQSPESYRVEASVRDLDLTRGGTVQNKVSPVHGFLQASLDLTRDAVNLHSLRITAHTRGAPDRTLNITGSLVHFANPYWQATIAGDLDMRLLDPTLGYPFTPEGIAHLNLTSGGQGGEFRFDGTVHAEKASYVGPGVTARGIDLTSRVHADSRDLRITSVVARLQQGGEMDGEVLLHNWLPPASMPLIEAAPAPVPPPSAPPRRKFSFSSHPQPAPQRVPQTPAHSTLLKHTDITIPVNGKVNATFKGVALDTVLDIVSVPPFQRLGIDAQLNGPARAAWENGDVNTLSVASTLGLSPSGRTLPGEAPATGAIDATYTQRDGAVDVRTLDLSLPTSQLTAHGRLGAYPLTSPTALSVEFHSGNLAEFDTVLRDLGLTRNGRSGAAALPVALNGQAQFQGTWAGSLASPRLTGSLKATQIAFDLPSQINDASGKPQVMRWDSITAEGAYDAEHIAIVHGQLQRGAAQILVDGTLVAAVPVEKHAVAKSGELPAFDNNAVLHLHAHAAKLSVSDLLPLAGVDAPITGWLDAQITADGPLRALGGSGSLQLSDGNIYGEPVSTLRAQGSLTNQVLKLTSVIAASPAGGVTGSGTYDVRAHRFEGQASGGGVNLAKIEQLRTSAPGLTGILGFHVTASGTRDDPHIEGGATVAGLTVQGQSLGALQVTAHTANRALLYDASTQLDSAELAVHGQTGLTGVYSTQAHLDFSRFDIATVFKLAHIDGISAQSALSGTADVAGPLAHPLEMRGDLRLQTMAMLVAGVHLQSEGGLHASLTDARLTLDPVHITGENTDLRAQGSLGLKDTRRIDFAASGSVNLKLAETLDRDVTSGGTSTFQVEAHGPLANPDLRGKVEFQNGSLALEDLPNGLSQLRGTLEFNQNRLEVRSLTAMTGGGQLSLGGYLAYQHGIYANLTVTGRSVRIRYPEGVSSLADANLQLQGTQTSLLLSGNILITRFSISPDLDIAALAAQANAVQPVAAPNAPSNHVRLDVRIQSSPQLNFQNAYAKLAGDVDLRLRGTVASPSLLGRISVTEGTATIAGTRYELQRGDITFTNPVRIQPTIDLNATARVEDYDITLGLHGTPEKMTVTYRSDPPLPEADVVALLALGRTQSEQGIYTEQQQQSVGLSPSTDVLLGGALNATVSSRVQKLFGAGSVKVDPSYLGALGNSTTRITVEEQLGKNVTLTYATNVDTTAQQLLQAEIAINRHVSLQVTRDESGVFSMVVKAIRRYR
jgi:translocation and assembly module TamB